MSEAKITPVVRHLRWSGWTDRGKVRKNNEDSFLGLQFDADLPSDCDAILRGREPQPGVYSLSVSALYVFERKFPEEVREFVRSAPYSAKHGWPAGPEVFGRAVDDVHGPDPAKQMMGRFARIDLSLPDKVLRADFDQYVAEQRAALAAIPGVHPYREALDELAARHALSLDSLVKHAVLPYIDIDRWRIGATATITAEGFADLLGIGQNALPKTREYAALLQRDFVLRGWLRPLASAAMRAPPTD